MRTSVLKILKSPLWNSSKKGFTLVEVVVVIAILSILTTFCILSFHVVPLKQAQADLYEMQSELRYLRKLAIQERKETSFKLDQGKYEVAIDRVITKSNEYHEKLKFESSTCQGEIIFSPTGKPQQAGTMVFSYGKHYKKLVVQPVNGRISIQEASYEKGL